MVYVDVYIEHHVMHCSLYYIVLLLFFFKFPDAAYSV